MEQLILKQKIAILRILNDILLADKIEDARESQYLDAVIKDFGLTPSIKKDVAEQNSLLALMTIRMMNDENKREFAKLMGRMIVVDRDINYNEVNIYNIVTEFCNIGAPFDDSDFPMDF